MMDAQVWKIVGALSLSYISNGFYIVEIVKGRAKPHLFSWATWVLLMGIAAAVAFTEGAYASGIIISNGCVMTFLIACLSLWRGEKNITKADYVMFGSALSIIPVWIATKEPLHAAILVTLIDLLGYGPTYRKAWIKPQQESLPTFILFSLIWVLNVSSITPYILTTALYPTAILSANAMLPMLLVFRRHILSAGKAKADPAADSSVV